MLTFTNFILLSSLVPYFNYFSNSIFYSYIYAMSLCDSPDLSENYFNFVSSYELQNYSIILTSFIYIVLLYNIADLLNPLTLEEQTLAQIRENEFRRRAENKLNNQRNYAETLRSSSHRHIWWKGWDNIPNTKLTLEENMYLFSLPTTQTYFHHDVWLYPNRPCNMAGRPNARDCPLGSVNRPITAKMWLTMNEQQP